jgi:hypothetical protein
MKAYVKIVTIVCKVEIQFQSFCDLIFNLTIIQDFTRCIIAQINGDI